MRRGPSHPLARPLACFLAGCLTSVQVAPATAAAQFRVFKKTYTRQSGAPVTVTETVPVLNPTGTPWTLRAINGDLEDTSIEKVSSSTLSLNGLEVLKSNQFNQTVALIEETVPLHGDRHTSPARQHRTTLQRNSVENRGRC